MSIIRALFIRSIFILSLLLGFSTFLLTTNAGLRLTLKIVNVFIPGKIQAAKIEGQLWQTLSLRNLTYVQKQQKVSIESARFKWHIVSLYPLHIVLDELKLENAKAFVSDNIVKIPHLQFKGAFKDNLFLVGSSKVLLPEGVVDINLVARQNKLESHIRLARNYLRIIGPLSGPWKIHADFPQMAKLHSSLQNLQASLLADAIIYDLQHISLKANLSSGYYKLSKESKNIDFKGASLNTELKSGCLLVKGFAELDANTSASINLNFADFVVNELNFATQKVIGQVKVSMSSLDFLGGTYDLGDFILNLQDPRGKLLAAVDVSGVLNKPKLTGSLSLENASLELPDIGLKLNPIKLNLKTDGSTWQLESQIRSNELNALNLKGQGSLLPKLAGEVEIDGDRVVVMNTSEYSVQASPHIICSMQDDAYKITGSILIPKARLSPASFTNTDTASPTTTIFSKTTSERLDCP